MVSGCIMIKALRRTAPVSLLAKYWLSPRVKKAPPDLLALIVKVVEVLVNGLETSDLYDSIIVVPFLIATLNKWFLI